MNGRRAWLLLYYGYLEVLSGLRHLEPLQRWVAVSEVYDGRCAICFLRGGLIIDHDHRTGLIRGDICRGCNTHARSDVPHRPVSPGRLAHYDIYAQYPPTAAVDLRGFYWGSPDPAPGLAETIWHQHPGGWVRFEPDIRRNNAAAKVGL